MVDLFSIVPSSYTHILIVDYAAGRCDRRFVAFLSGFPVQTGKPSVTNAAKTR